MEYLNLAANCIKNSTVEHRLLGIDVLYERALRYKEGGLHSYALTDLTRIQSLYGSEGGLSLGEFMRQAVREARAEGVGRAARISDLGLQVHSLLGDYSDAVRVCKYRTFTHTRTLHCMYPYLCVYVCRCGVALLADAAAVG